MVGDVGIGEEDREKEMRESYRQISSPFLQLWVQDNTSQDILSSSKIVQTILRSGVWWGWWGAEDSPHKFLNTCFSLPATEHLKTQAYERNAREREGTAVLTCPEYTLPDSPLHPDKNGRRIFFEMKAKNLKGNIGLYFPDPKLECWNVGSDTSINFLSVKSFLF